MNNFFQELSECINPYVLQEVVVTNYDARVTIKEEDAVAKKYAVDFKKRSKEVAKFETKTKRGTGGHGSGKVMHFQYIETEPRLRNTSAHLNNRVNMVDGNLVSRPGPRIVDGLEKFAELIHPELFTEAR